jgi:hypothetical protein
VTSTLLRLVGIMASVLIAIYGFIGVVRNDLAVPQMSRHSSVVLHFHGGLAWLCFTGMTILAIGIFRLLGRPFDDDILDFEDRRHRFGPIVLFGLGLFCAPQGMVGQ